jgi:hypothetical protein
LQNINILTELTKKYYKFQKRSQKKSQSCVPLRKERFIIIMHPKV